MTTTTSRGASLARPDVPDVLRYDPARRSSTDPMLRRGELVTLRPGVYTPRADESPSRLRHRADVLLQVRAALERLRTPYWFSHSTAALLWGCWTWRLAPVMHLTQLAPPSMTPRSEPSTRRHWTALPYRDRAVLPERGTGGDLPVTSLERTVVDCARSLRPAAALAVADSGLRLGADPRLLDRILSESAGKRGVRMARRVLDLADAASGSPGESVVRWVAVDAGLPVPALQIPVRTRLGAKDVDLGWVEERVGIEFDGAVKYSGGEYGDPGRRLMDEKRRHDAIVEEGWRLLRVTAEDLDTPDALAARLRAALRRAGPRGR